MTVTPIAEVTYWFDETQQAFTAPGRPSLPLPASQPTSWDWSDTNKPVQYASTAEFTEGWPSDTVYVVLQTGSSDFWTNVQSTVNATKTFATRFVIRLAEAVYHLGAFRNAVPTDPPTSTYAFGGYFPELQGFLGLGYDKTVIQMDANSMTSSQLSTIQAMTPTSSGSPLQMGLWRFDGLTAGKPILLGGLTFRAADQQNITAQAAGATPAVVVPQPAPHQGVVLYPGSTAILNNVLFDAPGRAVTSSPPFEMACVTSQRGTVTFRRCEFDGRRAAAIDPARPRRCGPFMANNETAYSMTDCSAHHSNISRGAINDQNANTSGPYSFTRVKFWQISNIHNTDPALNGGASLGGYTNASCIGFETCNSPITFTDCIFEQDDPFTDGQVAQMIQFTNVGTSRAAPTSGGPCTVTRGIFRNSGFPSVDGFLCFRISPTTFWATLGYGTTINATNDAGQRKTAYVVSAWPPSAASLAAAGVTPATHFLVRNS